MGRAEVSFLYLADCFPFFPTITKEHGPRLHLLKNCKSPVKAIAGNESYLHNSKYFRHLWFFACLETDKCDIFFYVSIYFKLLKDRVKTKATHTQKSLDKQWSLPRNFCWRLLDWRAARWRLCLSRAPGSFLIRSLLHHHLELLKVCFCWHQVWPMQSETAPGKCCRFRIQFCIVGLIHIWTKS